ncbi:MAG TPA: DUF4396 domain-containing protein [Ornithinimicrobium sp.]|uniref:DUF4396 domain-containing protein n=1 Tax=Ornithinimicrobium sp. TaxID=1977084 RepID=UPI002B4A6292|nr:DUF4396 domain-containing protein [Ornithinimicrobium sp.]HKJ11280.1 DUF4396 domain-containing protein [Ornithinimicrobium sp.]
MTQHQADHAAHARDEQGHDPGGHGDMRGMAASATMHCLTGCAIGEITGLVIGTALGLSALATIPLAVSLAFFFGYTLSTLPLLRAGLPTARALKIVLAADTLSILTMEVVDNAVMAVIPGAMEAGLVNPVFWASMPLAFTAAFVAAFPVNRWLLGRGQGHALTHDYHHGEHAPSGYRRFIPHFATTTLAAAVAAFMAGGLVVSLADLLV